MADLTFIMYRDPADQKLKLWACRGAGKGCTRNEEKWRRTKKPCEDCLAAHNEFETLEQFKKRLERGDA